MKLYTRWIWIILGQFLKWWWLTNKLLVIKSVHKQPILIIESIYSSMSLNSPHKFDVRFRYRFSIDSASQKEAKTDRKVTDPFNPCVSFQSCPAKLSASTADSPAWTRATVAHYLARTSCASLSWPSIPSETVLCTRSLRWGGGQTVGGKKLILSLALKLNMY